MTQATLYTLGYGGWTTKTRMEKLISALRDADVTTLVDIRHAPCSSGIPPKGSKNYWPKQWHLQPGGDGIAAALKSVGIEYRWLVELGNPQKTDVEMLVLREQIASKDIIWPVNRGLTLLKGSLQEQGETLCLMCACGSYAKCHRKLIAEVAVAEFGTGINQVKDLAS